jgi:hypothetical protein
MGAFAEDISPEDLKTPTLKSDVYTTGRGGSGNMAKNTDPLETRRAQDVEIKFVLPFLSNLFPTCFKTNK